jgi:hypothetical protein
VIQSVRLAYLGAAHFALWERSAEPKTDAITLEARMGSLILEGKRSSTLTGLFLDGASSLLCNDDGSVGSAAAGVW